MRNFLLTLIVGFASLIAYAAVDGIAFVDPLDAAAPKNARIVSSPLMAVARAGDRLVAVGGRGLIALSDDTGKSWRQAVAPVASDLVAVQFVTPQLGWATGHDGVVLHSADGGLTWSKQLDGRGFAKLMIDHFTAKVAAGDAGAQHYLDEVQRNFVNGPEQPFLGVWFDNEKDGFVTSAFGMMLATHDGGKTWESWMERVDNDDLLHLNSIYGVDGQVYVASEKGTVFRLDRAKQRFVALRTGYAGSFFGVVGTGNLVLAHGLQGTVYRSLNRGESWQKVETELNAGITTAATSENGRIVIATQDGRAMRSDDQGLSFKPVKVEQSTLFAGVSLIKSSIILVGLGGIRQAATSEY